MADARPWSRHSRTSPHTVICNAERDRPGQGGPLNVRAYEAKSIGKDNTMQPQMWKPVGLEYRHPQWQDLVNTSTFSALIHLTPQVPAGYIALGLLPLARCIRLRRAV